MTDMNFSFLAFSSSQNSLSIGILVIKNWLTKFYAICKIIRDVICGFYRLTLASMRNRYVGYIFICCPVKVWAKEVYYVSNCRGITAVYWVRIKTSYDNIYDTLGNLQVYRMTEFRHLHRYRNFWQTNNKCYYVYIFFFSVVPCIGFPCCKQIFFYNN